MKSSSINTTNNLNKDYINKDVNKDININSNRDNVNNIILEKELKPIKKKDYISVNGSVIKSTLDTGIKKKKKIIKQQQQQQQQQQQNHQISTITPTSITTIPTLPSTITTTPSITPTNIKNKKGELLSPIQTQTKINPHKLMRKQQIKQQQYNQKHYNYHEQSKDHNNNNLNKNNNNNNNNNLSSPISSPQRPFSLPMIEKKIPILSEREPYRSSTGDNIRIRPTQQTSSMGSLSLQIDVSLDEIPTSVKEKRQWREFKTLTEDRKEDDGMLDLVRLNSIGKGSSASVYKSVLFPSLQVVADKVVVVSNKEKSSQIVRELKSLTSVLQNGTTCDSIVKLLEVYPNPRDGTISMCLEYMNGGSLQDVVRDGGCQNEGVLAGISHMMLTGLAYLHSKRQLHRDIKPGNILLSSNEPIILSNNNQKFYNGRVKISDFGLSKELEKGHSLADSFLGTFHYMSPERISGQDYSFPSDIWSLGMTILAVALGRYPFTTPTSARSKTHSSEVVTEGDGGYWAILQAIQERPSIKSLLSSCQYNCDSHTHLNLNSNSKNENSTKLPVHFSKSFHSFLSQCLQKDPNQRPSANTLLQHSFFKSSNYNNTTNNTTTTTTTNTNTNKLHNIDEVEISPFILLADDFIHQCCQKHKEHLEAKAISARNRLSQTDLFANLSDIHHHRDLQPPITRSGEKTADNNAHRRRSRENSITNESKNNNNNNNNNEPQDEGLKQLRIVLKAYNEYIDHTWNKRVMSASNEDNPYRDTKFLSHTQQSAEKIILATLTPLHSKTILFGLSDALNVPIKTVKKSFQKIIRELKERIEGNIELKVQGDSYSSHSSSLQSSTINSASLTTLLERGFPRISTSDIATGRLEGVNMISPVKTQNNLNSKINSNTKDDFNFNFQQNNFNYFDNENDNNNNNDINSCNNNNNNNNNENGNRNDNNENNNDDNDNIEANPKLDHSDGSDASAVAELRALINTRSNQTTNVTAESLEKLCQILPDEDDTPRQISSPEKISRFMSGTDELNNSNQYKYQISEDCDDENDIYINNDNIKNNNGNNVNDHTNLLVNVNVNLNISGSRSRSRSASNDYDYDNFSKDRNKNDEIKENKIEILPLHSEEAGVLIYPTSEKSQMNSGEYVNNDHDDGYEYEDDFEDHEDDDDHN